MKTVKTRQNVRITLVHLDFTRNFARQYFSYTSVSVDISSRTPRTFSREIAANINIKENRTVSYKVRDWYKYGINMFSTI